MGPSIRPVGEIDAHIADFSATLLSRVGVSVANELMGRVLSDALANSQITEFVLPIVEKPNQQGNGDEKLIEQRLRALGYID